MKVEQSKITKLYITEIPNLDPITIYIEDLPPSRGKITIECYGEAWSYYWGSTGTKSIMEFFVNCDNQYLSEKFDPHTPRSINDEDNLETHAKQHIAKRRKDDVISKEEARRMWNSIDGGIDISDSERLYEIYGDEWWDCLPKMPNPKNQYLSRVLDACKEAIKLYYF